MCMGKLPRKHYTERCGAVWAVRLGTALAPDLAVLELRVLSDLGRATVLVVERRVSQGGLPHTIVHPLGPCF
jgi:hypothetical protein